MRRRQFSASAADDDPLSLVPNLFDVSIVLAVAFLVAAISISSRDDIDKNPMSQGLRKTSASVDKKASGKSFQRPGDQKAEGRGTRLGVAYQLENGEVIYVPDR